MLQFEDKESKQQKEKTFAIDPLNSRVKTIDWPFCSIQSYFAYHHNHLHLNQIITHSIIIMPGTYLRKLNVYNTPNIFIYRVTFLYLRTHLFLLSNRFCDGFIIFHWWLSASQKCHLSSISIFSVNRKLFNTFVWALNLTSPGFHYVVRCFRGRNEFLVCSLTSEKLFSRLLRFYIFVDTHLSYTSSVVKWK